MVKLTGARFDQFIKNFDPPAVALLLFGPDKGLVRERGGQMLARLAKNPDDPFAVSRFEGAALSREPGRLIDELLAVPFGGGRRVVRVADATDALAAELAPCLDPAPEATVILEAGELGKGSKLRKLCEDAANAVAVGCYAEEGGDLARFATRELCARGLTLDPDAAAFLAESLVGDRGVLRGELEKLALYRMETGRDRISRDDVIACTGRSAEAALDDLAFAAADGAHGPAQKLLVIALSEGVSPVATLRMLQRHLARLRIAAALVSSGQPPKQAMAALRPPVFFKQADRFAHQLRTWLGPQGDRRLGAALDRLIQAEAACKQTHTPDAAICGRAVLEVARLARK